MALSFNGSNQYLNASTAVATATPIAISAWFKTMDLANRATLVSLSRSQSGGSAKYFSLEAAGDVSGDPIRAFARSNVTTVGFADTTTGYSAGVWHHAFCAFYSNTSRKVWIDGGSEGSDTFDRTPDSIDATSIGVTDERGTLQNYLAGEIAEAAIWTGSGVENMGVREAAQLAAGFSPLCLTKWLNRMVLYQPLVRDVNWPGVGPAMSVQGAPPAVPHPRAIYPASPAMGLFQFPIFVVPYRSAAAVADANHVLQGWAAIAGPSVGENYPIGEVSS